MDETINELEADDLDELEARLYAQIHHEAVANDNADPAAVFVEKSQQHLCQRKVTNTSVINRQSAGGPAAGRYWISGQAAVANSFGNSKKLLATPDVTQSVSVGAGAKAATGIAATETNQNKKSLDKEPDHISAENTTKASAATAPTGKYKSSFSTGVVQTSTKPNPQLCTSVPTKPKLGANTEQIQQPNILKPDLRINPAAKAKSKNKKQKQKETAVWQPLDGPFAKQVHKLEKAKRLELKKQKSKRVHDTQRKQKPQQLCETIVLDETDESESDDVILVQVPPPAVLTVYDSDDAEVEKLEIDRSEDHSDETKKDKSKPATALLEMEDNALDASDVILDSNKSASVKLFAKPQPSALDKSFESSSRCTSPACSVQSADDFIGQNDRSRLLEGSGMADDEDLLLLTADVDSLMEMPSTSSAVKKVEVTKIVVLMPFKEVGQEDQSNDDVEFVAPVASTTAAAKISYRVDQPQFRALDVYESESDITDSVYSKGTTTTPKPTVIRTIGSSSSDDAASDNVEIITATQQKTKRLRKRRASGSNKESETNIEDDSCSEDGDGGVPTRLPGIARGPAVERVKSKSLRRDSGASSRRASAGGASVGQMSDGEFIATLNSLAQGGPGENNNDDAEEEDSDEVETPSAREIAAKVMQQANTRRRKRLESILLHQTTAGVVTERSISESDVASEVPPPPIVGLTKKALTTNDRSAVPDDLLAELDRVFETIDTLDQRDKQASDGDDEVVEIDPPDDDVASSSAAVIAAANYAVSPRLLKNKRDVDHPIYNVIYSRGSRFAGGIGWNDEMRRFYNSSWKGEHFSLQNVWSKMNPSKNVWKVFTEDRFPKDRRFNKLKCFNCCEFGHIRSKCKRPRKPLVCYMCGEHGHHEPRCPNTICLRCGNKTHVFTKSCNACTFQNRLICPVCKVRGHTLNLCPDKWRRYHSTTEPNTYPNSTVEYKNIKCCCICGGRGHLAENCKSSVRFMEYPTIVSEIKSHQKSYNDQTIRVHQSGIGFNLLYKPSEDFSFDLAENTANGKYYARFLVSVGMGYMLKRKRRLSVTSPAKRVKKLSQQHQQYVTNPYSKAGQEARNNSAPNQVQEVSESGSLAEDAGNDDNTMDAEAVAAVISSDSECEDLGSIVQAESTEVEVVEVVEEAVPLAEEHDTSDELNNSNELTIDETTNNVMNDPEDFTESCEVYNEHTNDFKAPTEMPSQSPKDKEFNLPMDSDSNYSFSEHFEMPTTSAAAKALGAVSLQQKAKPRVMEPLPDFIPLSSALDMPEDEEENENYDRYTQNDGLAEAGISRRFISAEDDDEDVRLSPLPDLPCEAKIYLTHFHSKYLLSPEGHNFLLAKSRECEIKARLDWTSVGHVLIIFGLSPNQDKFHRELLLKYRQLTDHMNNKRVGSSSLKVPRRIDALVRFLRENIIQLLSNLGNVNELLKRMRSQENQHSKTGSKMAEKTRRLLNMILLGQAGLIDGSLHLDKLLLTLKALINDFGSEEMAPNELRNEIEAHWKGIFTAYRHDNYPNLVQNYNRMLLKNRIPKLNIDPALLGQKVLDTSLTAEQKERLEQQPQQKQSKSTQCASSLSSSKHSHNIVPNPLNPKNSKLLHKKQQILIQNVEIFNSPPPPAPSMRNNTVSESITASNFSPRKDPSAQAVVQIRDNEASSQQTQTIATNQPSKAGAATPTSSKKQFLVPPCANPEQKSNVVTTIKEVAQKLASTYETLLTEIDDTDDGSGARGAKKLSDSKEPSMFWSRESIKYLDDCIKLAESGKITAISVKLQRVLKKSQAGSLSYNDYRAVIKLHNAMMVK